MANKNTVTLTVNGLDYAGWLSVRIEAGVERIARSFELAVVLNWPGNNGNRLGINPGDLCYLAIDQDLVCTGFIDATPISYDADHITVMLRGRSLTADLVDCSADNTPGQFNNQLPEKIIEQIADDYGISVIVQTATGAAITQHQIQQGETAFESIDRIAKLRQFLVTDDESGNIVLATPGSNGQATTALQLGINILSASAGFDYSEVYTQYQVKGQKSGTDDSFGPAASSLLGTATDSTLTRARVLIVRQSGQADQGTCQQRADYEAGIRKAKSGEIRYRVVGWRQADGTLWKPNTTVQVIDANMGVNTSLLISSCQYSLDDSGLFCDLTVIPPEAFLTDPEKAVTKSAGSDSGWSS